MVMTTSLGIIIIPIRLYFISDIQRVSYCRGYLSGTARNHGYQSLTRLLLLKIN